MGIRGTSVLRTGHISASHVTPVAHTNAPRIRHGSRCIGNRNVLRNRVAFGMERSQCKARVARSGVRQMVDIQASSTEKTVAVAGATGLIGSRLIEMLVSQGYTVKVLTRNPAAAKSKLPYPGLQFASPVQWKAAIQGTDAVVNLAGEPIATRWNQQLKEEIKRSRVQVTKRIVDAINSLPEGDRPNVLVNSSAVGYYGTSESATFNESSPSGDDYLAEVCREWEGQASRAECRVVKLRTGIVLAREGGALAKMVPVFSMFAGGPLGSGRQWFSWIHRDDVVGMIMAAIQDPSWQGVYNATAPKPVRMGELCSALGEVMGRPSFVPVPDFALKTLLGEGAQVVLEGQRVLPNKAQTSGYEFKYTEVHDALRNLLQ